MAEKRITLFAGHYGSGKTNIAVNYAFHLKKAGYPTVIADLDIVNPYFRTKDSEEELKEQGIDLICSEFANTNLDIPSLPQTMYRVVHDKSSYAVMDIGGDDAGAVALGRFSEAIASEDNYEMLFVLNFFRPLTRTAEEAYTVLKEIEFASKLKFTGVVNNSNLGELTTAEDVASTFSEAERFCEMSGLPLKFVSAEKSVSEKLVGKSEKLFPLELQKKYY